MNLLPKELDYLEVAASELAKLPPEEIDELAATTQLEAALRDRVKGLTLREAVSRLTEDHKRLKGWIKESKTNDGGILFLAAYLMRPGPLARQLLAPPLPPDPTIGIDPPQDWISKAAPRSLVLKKGKQFCAIWIWDKSTFESRQWDANKREEMQRSSKNPWANLGVWTRQTVKFGESTGEKFVYSQSGNANWKQVDYLLEIPGGLVEVRIGHEAGRDFDESEIEACLSTLKVIPPTTS
jgi:hypothetical protein